METQKIIENFFKKTLNDIDAILKKDFYSDKFKLEEIRSIIKEWYKSYKEKITLKEIDYKKIEFIQDEIYNLFDNYYENESVDENYSERLLYDFGHIVRFWKDEMLGDKHV